MICAIVSEGARESREAGRIFVKAVFDIVAFTQ